MQEEMNSLNENHTWDSVDLPYGKKVSKVRKKVGSCSSIASYEKQHQKHFDVKTVLLNGKLQEEVYMKQPEGFEDETNRVCKLNKSVYDLKQSPRRWNKHHFTREKYKADKITIKHVDGARQVADIVTKFLQRVKFKELRKMLGLVVYGDCIERKC
ncbi:hypothetical protein PPYR_14648 [Photinus pyralis]|uniref:Reverse transcriptase Ty1/copia-type domain-containing protein n=1 Tax=Photinus pyralis TaxID=7054 RepID=A0A5N4A5Z5_PHOPY|nr:hypothetical protein PPYR_14648 [Photinus pyralis]